MLKMSWAPAAITVLPSSWSSILMVVVVEVAVMVMVLCGCRVWRGNLVMAAVI